MRVKAVAGGVVFLMIGLAFLVVPFAGQSVGSHTFATTGGTLPYVFFEPALTPGSLTFHVGVFASTSVTVSVYSCGSDTSCSGGSSYEQPGHLVAQGSGTDALLTFSGAAGTGYEAYSAGSSVIDVTYDGPLLGGFLGAVFAVLGGLALLVGLVARPSKRGAGLGRPGGRSKAVTPASALPPAPAPPASSGSAGIAGYSGLPGESPPPPPR